MKLSIEESFIQQLLLVELLYCQYYPLIVQQAMRLTTLWYSQAGKMGIGYLVKAITHDPFLKKIR